jgi:hypothetical protein
MRISIDLSLHLVVKVIVAIVALTAGANIQSMSGNNIQSMETAGLMEAIV